MPRVGTQRVPSGERPPALTTAWRWGWKSSARVYGVQHHRDGGQRAQAPGVARQRQQRLRRRPEAHREEGLAVVPDDRPQRLREREDDVEVARREDPLAPRLEPAVLVETLARRAVPVATRVVDRRRVAAGVAHREVAAEGGGAAAGERHEHLVLRARERRGLPQRVGEDAHDVAHLHPRGGVVTRALEAVDGGPHGPLPEALTLLGIQ